MAMTHPTTAEAKLVTLVADTPEGEVRVQVQMTERDIQAIKDGAKSTYSTGYTIKSAPPAPAVGPIATSNVRTPQPPTEDKRDALLWQLLDAFSAIDIACHGEDLPGIRLASDRMKTKIKAALGE